MATTTTARNTFEEALNRITEVNENLFGLAKESGRAALDTYETAVQSLVDFEKAAADQAQIDWINKLANTHAKFVQDITSTYLKVTRAALK